jgi:hypothetical protein
LITGRTAWAGSGGLFAFHADRLGPTRTTKGEIMTDARVQESSPFILVCNAACNCATELANLRRLWGRYFLRKAADDCIDIQDFGLSALAASISRLMYDLKLLKDSFPAVAWPLPAVRSLPPPTVTGTPDAASYHDTVFDMANAFLHHFAAFTQCGREILDLVDGPAVPPADLDRIFADPSLSELRNKIAQKVRFTLRNPLISSGLYGFMESVQEFDANALVARLQHEAARALATSSVQSQQMASSEPGGGKRNDGACVALEAKPDGGQGKDNVNSAPPAPDQAIGLPKQPEESVPKRLVRTDAEADSAKDTLAEPAKDPPDEAIKQPVAVAPLKGTPVVADAGHQDVMPTIPATVASAPHEATGGQAPDVNSEAPWYHEPSEPKPPDYKYGPLIGTKKQIGQWLGEKDTRTPRRLEQKAKALIAFVYRNGETTWEAWFKVEKTWEQAKIKRDFG